MKRGKGAKSFADVVDAEFDKAGLTRLKSYQIDNIYVTKTSLAYGSGQMSKMLEGSGDFPYWKYSATMDSRTRPDHAALHGKIFRTGDFTFFPPIGFRCRCTAIPLTARQAAKYLKSAMPDEMEKKLIHDRLTSKEFVGNKQQKYLEWVADQYEKADAETRKLMDEAMDRMKQDIRDVDYRMAKEFFGSEGARRIEREYTQNKRVQKATKEAGLTNADGFRLFAYTDYENGLSAELARIHYSDRKPELWTRAQLERFKKDLSKTLAKLPGAPGVVYRNLNNVPADVIKQFTRKGAVIVWDGFSSTTTDPAKYADRAVRLVIDQRSARNIEEISKYSDEKEALLPSGTRLKVTRVEKNDSQTVIYMERSKRYCRSHI